MKASKFTENQIAFVLRQGEEEASVEEICRKAGISLATYYNGKKTCGRRMPSEMSTSTLDPEMVREVPKMVREVRDVILELSRGGLTSILVTREMVFARKIADRAIFISNGEMVEPVPSRDRMIGRDHPATCARVSALRRKRSRSIIDTSRLTSRIN